MSRIEAVDLFCGAGGLTSGLIASGIKVVGGVDFDLACQYPFEANHPGAKFVYRDVGEMTGPELDEMWSENAIRLLAGCAPCQPFSSYARNKAVDHEKWGMLFHFARLVRETNPHLVTMENVPGLLHEEPFKEFLSALRDGGYEVVFDVLNGADYGVPQNRRRLVLMASRIGGIELPKPTNQGSWITVKDAIGDLPSIRHGQTHPDDPLHVAAKMSPLNFQRIKASKPGGTWRDWPEHLLAECHKRESGKNSAGVYGRMEWGRPAPTMTTLCTGFGNGRYGHPKQNRAITLREAAIFQSFPIDYNFFDPSTRLSKKSVSRMIGNAVPPKLGEAIGKVFVKNATKYKAC